VHENLALRVPHFVVVPLIVAGASAQLVKVKVPRNRRNGA